ncbi:MAG: hypothetical protein IJ033_02905 [Clostridia bacterium]|nr:hypothetical protein [Clostridia bacterium]
MEKLTLKKYFALRLKDKAFAITLAIYMLLCLLSAIHWCINFVLRDLLMSLAFIAVAPLIIIAEHFIKFRSGLLFTIGVFIISFGSILGSSFNLYTVVPFFDTILHGLSGVLFGCLGFTLAERFFGKASDKKKFFGSLVFALSFSLAIAVLWEIFEFTCTILLGFDMMEDTVVTNVNSYLLAGSHAKSVELDNIAKTVIYYGNDHTYTINGYLDIGLIDTLADMIICTIGSIVFMITSIIGFFKCPKINQLLIPQVICDTH